jgi:hypothetical protein
MICSRLRLPLAGLVWFPLLLPQILQAAPDRPISYNRDIRPVLSDNCFYCHGPDQHKRKAKLRLDVREEALARKAFIPGNAKESELVRRIFSSDEDERMPPPKSEKKLSSAQKELLRRWIEEGAHYEKHWAFIPPVRPPAPSGSRGIDSLIEEHLKEAGLQLSPEADRRTLIRRLYEDLIGLPPGPEAVKAFEHDSDPDAYSKLVEQLLASPAYGERMALGWLDVVRYADTIGYHSDNPRNVWPYRDYVINSFNENKPFDQFTREQLAGDLLPNSTLEQKVASAFNRLLLTTEEGGAQPKDYEARMLTDRVRAIGTVWLAQTFGCCQCHDHKFDPIKSRDFYSMGAFFADLKEPIIGRREDGMLVPDAKQKAELTRLQGDLAHWREQYEQPRPAALADWEQAATEATAEETNWIILEPEQGVAQSGDKLSFDLQGVVHAEKDPKHGTDTYRIRVRPDVLGITGIRLEALPSERLPGHGPGRAEDGGFVLTQFSVEDENNNPVPLATASATFEAEAFPATAAILPNPSDTATGWAVHGESGLPQAIYFRTQTPLDAVGDSTLTFILKQTSGNNRVLGQFRLAVTTEPAVVRAPRVIPPPRDIAKLLKMAPSHRSPAQEGQLAEYQRSIAPELAGLRQHLASAQKAKDQFEAALPHCLVSVSMDPPRTVRILPRGNWMIETGDIVEPALPAYLAGATNQVNGRRLTRLDLANWLVSRDNPLTARVFVNRLWKQFFGMGLSKVLDDFGAQGEPPPDQPLLDWLACEFMESDWDIKHMVRLMVNTHAYRQSSTSSKELRERDPYNREIARQSRWRLDAELVRDNALAISGLLATRIGGPSVKPYQPDGYWDNLNFPVRTYEASTGPDQYRRGLYTWWQRSYLHPSLLAFDAPTREECTADRPRSNIPQQALVLLNDPTYVEASRAFAASILKKGGTDVESRINWAWWQALDRAPRPDELQTVQSVLYKALSEFKQNPSDADALLKVGQMQDPGGLDHQLWAAWTQVARVILNLHETITRS